MHRGDRGLQCIRPGQPRGERALDEREPALDLLPIPARAVLLGEQHHLPLRRRARLAPRVVQQHEREQPVGLAPLGGAAAELDQQLAEPQRFVDDLAAH